MKRFSSLLLTAAVAIATSVSATAQTADEVVKSHIKAIGGEEAWRKVNTMKMAGSLNMQGMEIPVTLTMTQNVGKRLNITAMGMDGYVILTPKAGWMYMPFMGQSKPEPMPEEAMKAAAGELDMQGELIDYAKKGSTVKLDGKETVDGTEYLKLVLTPKEGDETVYFIDPTTYYVMRAVSKVDVEGKETEMVQKFDKYQKLPEGIVVPMFSDDPGLGPITFTSVEVNKPVEASTYEPTKG